MERAGRTTAWAGRRLQMKHHSTLRDTCLRASQTPQTRQDKKDRRVPRPTETWLALATRQRPNRSSSTAWLRLATGLCPSA
eukprot:5217232-Pleurochrysis_carterae.AAC.2